MSSILPGSTVVAATGAQLRAVIAHSAIRSSQSLPIAPAQFLDLTALEVDPAGGTWTATPGGAALPNLLFAWHGVANDGGIVATRGGGEIATVNGVRMGSVKATFGTHLGVVPAFGVGFGLQGLALIPAQPPLPVVENHPVDAHFVTATNATWHRFEIGGMTPGALAHLFLTFGPTTPGGFVPSVPYGLPTGEFFLGPFQAPPLALPIDDAGTASLALLVPSHPALPGFHVVAQALDGPTFRLSTPAAVQFL